MRVDLGAIAHNLRYLRGRVGRERAFYAVVKADAYGHGAAAVARRLAREGVDRFAVANPEEGAALRRAGVAGEVLVLSRAEPEDLPRLRAYGLTPTLYDLAQAEAVLSAAVRLSGTWLVQLELDTGMGRAGIRADQIDAVASRLRAAPGVALSGTFAALSAADDPASAETERQVAGLEAGAERLRAAGIPTGLVHAANSAGILAHPRSWLDGVRPGLALYGVAPSDVVTSDALAPAMSIEARVVGVRRVPSGTPIGYGGRFVTARETTIAVVPIGYHDGLRRVLSGKSWVLLRGRRVPVVGAISMDVSLVDATDTGASRGDRVTFLGREGEASISAWDLARAAGTIPYEILCGIGSRAARVYAGGDAGC